MEIDWPRTLAVGGLTATVMAAIYLADTYEAIRAGEEPTGPLAPFVGMVTGLTVGLILANLLLA